MNTKLTFWGATGTVTGSRFGLDIDNRKMLIECGMFQGPKRNREKNWELFPVPPKDFDTVILTHAHIDHSGYLPRFCREGFKGKVHCTESTNQLCRILLKDSAHLQEEDARWANKKGFSKHKPALPLYTVKDAENSLRLFSPLHYGQDMFLTNKLRLKLRDAGHILGSSLVDIKLKQNGNAKKILFAGDLGRPERPLLRDPVQVYDVDYLILESTYGDRVHKDIDYKDELEKAINDGIDRGGVILIPSFAVGRTQTLLFAIRELEEENRIPNIQVFMDSPMALEATRVFEKSIRDLDLDSRLEHIRGKEIFRPKNIHYCKSVEQSKNINKISSHAIIISSSGMATGGRVLHHLVQRLPYKTNTILFAGYQAYGTRGRYIVEGNETIKIHGRQIPVNAHIERLESFSSHADYEEILAWLYGFNKPPQMTYLVHGEPDASKALAEKIKATLGWNVTVPDYGNSFDLDI